MQKQNTCINKSLKGNLNRFTLPLCFARPTDQTVFLSIKHTFFKEMIHMKTKKP